MMNCLTQGNHGGDIYSRRVAHDFSASLNPLGMPASVKKALADNIEAFENYPDINCTVLRKAIAARDGCDEETIVCGNGAADLIYRAVQVFQPRRALIPAPTFSEYERALKTFGCEVARYETRAEDGFHLRGDFVDNIKNMKNCDMVFLCNPGNPAGNLTPTRLLHAVMEGCARRGAALVIDECFMDFTEEKPFSPAELTGNVMLLRAFTKIYAMAGLRLGYMICSNRQTARHIKNCGQCWSVSVPAQIAGVAALGEREWVERTVKLITEERHYLTAALENLGLEVFPSSANFLLFRCGLPLDEILLKQGIAIRNCADYHGLSGRYFRIAVRTHEENTLLISAVKEAMKNG